MVYDNNSDVADYEYRTCYSKFHVRAAATFIAEILLIFHGFILIAAFYDKHWIEFSFIVIVALLEIGIIVADKYEKPFLYSPFIIFNAIILFFNILFVGGLVILNFVPVDIAANVIVKTDNVFGIVPSFVYYTYNDIKTNVTAILICLIIAVIIFEFILFYCWYIVRKAQAYMIAEVIPKNNQNALSPNRWRYQSPA